MTGSTVIAQALKGLSAEQQKEVIAATKTRGSLAAKLGTEVDYRFVERTIAEYAEDIKHGRVLDDSGTILVPLGGRYYGEQYESPRERGN